MQYNYLKPGTYYELNEKIFTELEATKHKLVPFTLPYKRSEYWMVANVIADCKLMKVSYALVKESNGQIAVWKALHTKQTK